MVATKITTLKPQSDGSIVIPAELGEEVGITSEELVVAEPVLVEIEGVLQRPLIRQKSRTLEEFGAEAIAQALAGAMVVVPSDIPPTSRDPKDDKYLATAQAADADYLVTEDNDLL